MTTVEDGLLLDTVRRFAAKAEQRMFTAGLPDGDLSVVDELLVDAATLGLLAGAGPDSDDWGAWGAHSETDGAATSLDILRGLGRVCAGLATAVHAQGLGVLLLGAAADGVEAGARLAAGFCPPVGVALDSRSFGDGLLLRDGLLSGTARFALLPGRAEMLVLAARTGRAARDGWVVVTVPPDRAGIALLPAGARVGLRAAGMADVRAEQVSIGAADIRMTGAAAEGRLRLMIACDWLGQAAIALGTAERAVAEASAYAGSRVQGGVPICEHAAVKLLLGRAEHDAAVLSDVLYRYATTPFGGLGPVDMLRWAADARLVAGEHAARAVTDALQTLGGYGYMDEYGLSKRLRDLTALRVLHGAGDQLLLLRHGLGGPR